MPAFSAITVYSIKLSFWFKVTDDLLNTQLEFVTPISVTPTPSISRRNVNSFDAPSISFTAYIFLVVCSSIILFISIELVPAFSIFITFCPSLSVTIPSSANPSSPATVAILALASPTLYLRLVDAVFTLFAKSL